VRPASSWPDAWAGSIHGVEQIQRRMTALGARIDLLNATDADSRVVLDQSNGPGRVETWQGKQLATAHVAFDGRSPYYTADEVNTFVAAMELPGNTLGG